MTGRLRIGPAGLFLFILIAAALPLTGGGKGEDTVLYTMDDADRLIEEKNYNRAIEVLIALSQQDPELFEQAQQKIKGIKTIRDDYNRKYDELITVLFDNEDYEQALELISELDQLDNNPNEATKMAIRDARISAELIYYKKIFEEIMALALTQLTQGEYLAALETYETGFDLFRQTFDENPYGDLIKDPVYRAYDELTQLLERVKTDWDALAISPDQAESLRTDREETMADMVAAVTDLVEIRNGIYRIARVYDRQNDLIMEGNDGVQDFHLSFMTLLMTGRLTSGEWEGIAMALDYYLEESLDRADAVLAEESDGYWERGVEAFGRGDWAEGSTLFDASLAYVEDRELLLGLNSGRIYLDRERSIDRLGTRIAEKYYHAFRGNLTRKELIAFYADLIEGQEALDVHRADFESLTRPGYDENRNRVVASLESTLPLIERLSGIEASLGEDPLLEELPALELARLETRTDNLIDRARNLETEIVTAMADVDIDNPEALLAEYESRLSLDEEYLSGYDETGAGTILFRYPQRALADLELLAVQMAALTEEGQAYRDTYREEQEQLFNGAPLDPYLARIDDLIARSRNLTGRIALLREDGENFILLAQQEYNAGEFRFSQAEQQLRNSNFELARSELSKAQELYVAALSYDEESFSRDDLDARIADLQARIVDEENKKVIREVRELINQGKELYFQGLYAQGEARLIQAENRWFTTNTEENTELSYWMSLIRTALSVESGRILEESNPLYNEISQLLNLAWKYYDRGVALLNENRKIEAVNALTTGEGYLEQVLVLMPLNQNARVLSLRILKAQDEDNFSATFANQYRNALAKADFQPDEAYLELKDLAEIIPNYGGIQSNILNLEYALGIKIPPPDPAKLRESARLYQNARATFDSGNINLFEGAIEQLNRAITLNPNNNAAVDLIDQMRLYEGGQTTAVLPSTALAQYQSAEEFFVNGEYLSSYQIIQDLWRNSSYQAYPPLKELKRRVEAKLGI